MLKSDKIIKIIATAAVLTLIFVLAKKTEKSELPEGLPQPVAEQAKTTTLFFAGDIMLSRNVANKLIEARDYTLPFGRTADIIRDADISFANLESPFLDKLPFAQQGLVFKADPQTINGLLEAGFDVLATANNHAFDQGLAGVNFTIIHLKSRGIIPIGTGPDCHEGAVFEKNGLKFGFLAYSYAAYNDAGKQPSSWVCDWKDMAKVALDIKTLKPKVDFLIVSTHTGTEYQRSPDDIDAQRARGAVDAGADLVVGHHPHWVQTIEQYRGKWIFYSLGNFVFDQMWSTDTREGLTLLATFKNQELSNIALHPVIIDDYCCPRWANETESLTILNKINLTSGILLGKND